MKLRILKTHNASRDGMRTEELLIDTIVDFPCHHAREVELVAMITREGLAVEVSEEEAAEFLRDLAEGIEYERTAKRQAKASASKAGRKPPEKGAEKPPVAPPVAPPVESPPAPTPPVAPPVAQLPLTPVDPKGK